MWALLLLLLLQSAPPADFQAEAERLFALGVQLYSDGDTASDVAGAVAAFEGAGATGWSSGMLHYNLGTAYGRQDMFPEAFAAYKEAARIRPDYAKAHVAMGNLLYQNGSSTAAEDAYRSGIEVDPDYARAYLALATLQTRSGNDEEAVKTLDRLLERRPGERRVRALRRQIGGS